MVFLRKRREKGTRVERVGGGVGTGKGTSKSLRTCLSKLPFGDLSFRFFPIPEATLENLVVEKGVREVN